MKVFEHLRKHHGIACFIVEKPVGNEASAIAHCKLGFERIGEVFLEEFVGFKDHISGVYFRPGRKAQR